MYTLYYRQLSADSKIRNYEINSSFVSYKGLKARAYKTGMIDNYYHLYFLMPYPSDLLV